MTARLVGRSVALSARLLLGSAVVLGTLGAQALTGGHARQSNVPMAPIRDVLAGSTGSHLTGGFGTGDLVAGSAATQSVLEQIAARQFGVRLTGIRHVRFYKEGRLYHQIRERITILPANGTQEMQFKLELDSSVMPRLDLRELAIARERYAGHSAFLFFDRDFHVQNARLAQLNYSITSQIRSVAGRQVAVHSIRPNASDRSSYEVHTDLADAIVVRAKEFNAFGQLVFDTDYESYQIGEAAVIPPGFPFWQPIHQVRSYPDVAAATQALQGEFTPRIPRPAALPAGYVFSQVRITTVDEAPGLRRRYLVLEYTDGIDCLFMVESAAPVPANESPTRFDGVHQCVLGAHSQSWAWKNGVQYLVVARTLAHQVPALLKATLRG
jgi:hypothetical protein